MLPKRRHSIQVVPPACASSGAATAGGVAVIGPAPVAPVYNKNRRQSISESLQSLTKSMSSSLQKAMHLGSTVSLEEGKNKLNKAFFKEVLSAHYNQPDLKITKLCVRLLSGEDTVQHYPTSTVTDLLINDESKNHQHHVENSTKGGHRISSSSGISTSHDYVDPEQLYYLTIYEAEVWLKYNGPKGTVKKKLDLVAKCHPKSSSRKQSHQPTMFALGEEDGNGVDSDSTNGTTPPNLASGIVKTDSVDTTGTSGPDELTSVEERTFEAERDNKAHITIVQDMWNYLRTNKGVQHPEDYLSLPVRYRTDDYSRAGPLSDVAESQAAMLGSSEPDQEDFYRSLFLIQDLYSSGYRMADVEPDENGLDFTHSLLAIAKLAAFHAVSYCMKKEKDIDFLIQYPFLQEDPVYRPATLPVFTRAQNNLARKMHNIYLQQNQSQLGVEVTPEQAAYFEEAVKNLHEWQARFVDPEHTDDKFTVLCHGDLWMQNVVFSYGSCLESQSDVVDVRFDDLHHARFASCATDIHNLLYYTVDADIRQDHTVNLLSVYHDHFSKTVRQLCPGLAVFSRAQLLMEFHRLLPFGFLEGLTLFSTAYETQLRKKEADEKKCDLKHPQDNTWSGSKTMASVPRYSDYRDTVLSVMADVARLKFQGVIPGAPTTGVATELKEINEQKLIDQQNKAAETPEKVLVTPL